MQVTEIRPFDWKYRPPNPPQDLPIQFASIPGGSGKSCIMDALMHRMQQDMGFPPETMASLVEYSSREAGKPPHELVNPVLTRWRQTVDELVRREIKKFLPRTLYRLKLHRTIPKGLVRRHGLKKALQVWPRRARLKAWRRVWGRAWKWDFQKEG